MLSSRLSRYGVRRAFATHIWYVLLLAGCGGGDPAAPTPPVVPPAATVASIVVTLPASSVEAGTTVTANAVLRSPAGTELTGRSVSWSTSNAAVATVSSAGVVSTLTPGTVTVTATSEGRTGEATLTVTPIPVSLVAVTLPSVTVTPGDTVRASAVARSAAGAALSGRLITWGAANPAVATVNESGLITAIAVGSTVISATSEGRTGTATLTVVPLPVGSVTVTLSANSVERGTPVRANAVTRAASGAVLTDRAITWTSSNPTVATVGADGTVTTLVPGTTTITAASEGRSGGATLTVLAPAVATVTLDRDSLDVPLRASVTLIATAREASGAVITGRTVTWSSSDPAVASVNTGGVVRLLAPGTVTITASVEGRSARARVRGTLANLAAVVDSVRLAYGLPAMGAVIVSRRGQIGLGVAGTRRVTGGAVVTTADRWHIGSNTKAITGVLAGLAVQAGVVAWNRTVETGLADLSATMRAEYRAVTITELLSHVSGVINSNIGLTGSTNRPQARTLWAQSTLQQAPNNARGTYFYSNNGYGIVGAMLERAWGSPYEDLMATRVFAPLGITDAGWGPTTASGGTDQPVGHRLVGGTWQVCEACDNPPGLAPAGTLHLSLGSWGRIAQELLLADQGGGQLLSQNTARFLTTNAVPPGNGTAYGMGWGISGPADNRMVGHDGSNNTNHSRAVLYLDAGVAFLTTINAADLTGGTTGRAHTALQQRLERYWTEGR